MNTPARQAIRVTFDDGDTLETEINGTPDEILRYYLGQTFNLGQGEHDRLARAVKVEFLTDDEPEPATP